MYSQFMYMYLGEVFAPENIKHTLLFICYDLNNWITISVDVS